MSRLAYDLGRDKPGAWTQLAELERRDWAVRVLDAWADALPDNRAWLCAKEKVEKDARFVCVLRLMGTARRFNATDPAAARLAAAESVWPELPESVRDELGERP